MYFFERRNRVEFNGRSNIRLDKFEGNDISRAGI